MKHFKFYTKEDTLSLTNTRRFETKIGERVNHLVKEGEWPQVLQNCEAIFIVLGIPEDIGVKANYGIGGTDTSWVPFLSSFLNMQSNDFFTGENVLVLGHFDFGDLKYLIDNNAYNQEELIDAYRHAVSIIDDEVETLLKTIAAYKKIPIVIGGGHNNAYPIIKGVAKGLHKAGLINQTQINCINVDAHADFRTAEGRHSGNAFRYAEADGFLNKYCLIGVQENYLPQNVLFDIYQNDNINYITFEDIFLHQKQSFEQAILHAVNFTNDTLTGIELDIDIIENVLSSAVTPCGIATMQARQYITQTATQCKPAYLHLCEAAAQLTDGRKSETVGKLLSYLVSDFIKAIDKN
jgi:formiminoglutamase